MKTITLFFLILLLGCSKQTEEEKFEKMQHSIKYKMYRLASKPTIDLAVSQYNKKSDEKINAETAHGALALFWFMSGNNEFAFIEGDMITTAENDALKIFGTGIKSATLTKMEMKKLALKQYEELKIALANQKQQTPTKIDLEIKMSMVGFIIVGLSQDDAEMAKFGADALSSVSELDYLPNLVSALAEGKKGNLIKAFELMKELNKSEKYSQHKQELAIAAIEIIGHSHNSEKLTTEGLHQIILKMVKGIYGDMFKGEKQIELEKLVAEIIQKLKTNDAQNNNNPEKSEALR